MGLIREGDGGARRFVLIQREEAIQDEDFDSIADIAQARLAAAKGEEDAGFQILSL